MSDVTIAARRYLMTGTDLKALLGSNATFSSYIFRWKLYVQLEGSGLAAVVLAQRGGWTTPNRHNTAEFPRLQTEVYVDPSRAGDQNPSNEDAETRAHIVFQQMDELLHLVDGGGYDWGGTRIVSSVRDSEPDIADVPGGDGMVRLLSSYAVTVG